MSNLKARESLERAKRIFLEKPAVGRKPNTAATAVWREGLILRGIRSSGRTGSHGHAGADGRYGRRFKPGMAFAGRNGFVRRHLDRDACRPAYGIALSARK